MEWLEGVSDGNARSTDWLSVVSANGPTLPLRLAKGTLWMETSFLIPFVS